MTATLIEEAKATLRRTRNGGTYPGQPILRRIFARCEVVGDCWIWQGAVSEHGYGRMRPSGKYTQASVHRIVYAEMVGPIPDGHVVCHRCDTPRCCNPAHLFVGTMRDNMQDCARKGRRTSANALKTHCRRGHEFTPENTITRPSGWRRCRTCRDVQNKMRSKRGRAELGAAGRGAA